MGEKTKIQIAKDMIRNYLETYPNNYYALIVFGSGIYKGCQDVNVAVPFEEGNIPKILKYLNTAKPYGLSPLGEALKMGNDILSQYPEEGEILLFTDSLDNCSTSYEDILPDFNHKGIRLNGIFLFFSDKDRKKMSSLNSLDKKRIIDYPLTQAENVINQLNPEEGKILSQKQPDQFKPASLMKNQNLKPEYPYLAKRYGLEGKATIKIFIDEKGKVYKVEILKSSGHKMLDKSAINTAKKWRFHPARLNDQPAKDYQKKVIVFNLMDDEE